MFSSTLRTMRVRDARRQAKIFERAFEGALERASLDVVTEFAASNLEVSYDSDWDLAEGVEDDMGFWDDSSDQGSERGSKTGKGKEVEERIPFIYQPPDENDPADHRSDMNTLLWLFAATNIGTDQDNSKTPKTEPSNSDTSMDDAEDLEQRDVEMEDVLGEPETKARKLEGISTPETATSGTPFEPEAHIQMGGILLATEQGNSGKKFSPGVHVEHVENVKSIIEGVPRREDDGSLEAAQLEGSSESAMPRKDDQKQVKKPSPISVGFLEGTWYQFRELQEFCEWEDAHEWNRTHLRKMLREPFRQSRTRHRQRSRMPYPQYGRSRSPLGVSVMTDGPVEDTESAYAAENVKW
ncbi:hypothetical protein BDP55DRAFT_745390 [Colletotrichum godetiae]|uniref:Uncharacterized protein n=1 Tax=Colletotrichum godetiae TaxID=1209918 RepID=A0AAJ0AJF7_9PEZI|nr:uncharacterized protein BDP55DRAFT_745390 [Colletotrichum godetiae]KAK1675018.1 hypothetical protein BDP55DRAFT_745390 [Colletotrichum godetiae]